MTHEKADPADGTTMAALSGIRGNALYLVSAVFIVVDVIQTFFMQGSAPGMTAARIGGIVALVFFIASPVVYRLTGKRQFASTIFLIATYVVIVFSALKNGGTPAPTMSFLTLLPLAAMILIGRTAGIISAIAVGSALAFLYLSTTNGMAGNSPHSAEQLRALFTSSVFLTAIAIMFIAMSYEKLVQSSLSQLSQARDKLLEQSAIQQSHSAKLQLLKRQHDTALASAGVGVWEYSIGSQTLSWSGIIHDILRTQNDSGETEGAFVESRIHPDDVKSVKSAMEKSALEGTPFSIVFRMLAASGEYVFIESRGDVLCDSEGVPLSLTGTYFDVTEESKAEKLRLVIWDTLLDQSNDAAAKFESVLTMLADYFGLEFGLISRIQQDDYYVEHVLARNNEVKAGDHFDYSHTYCSHVYFADGPRGFHCVGESEINTHPCYSKFKLEAYIGAPIFVEGERYGTLNFSSASPRAKSFSKVEYKLIELVAQWIGYEIGRDRNMQSLRQSEVRFALAAQGSSVGIWDWHDVGKEKQYWSDHFYELLGYAPQEFEPSLTQFTNLLHPDDHANTFAAVDAHLAKESRFRVEYRLRCKNEEYRWFLGTGQAVWDEAGVPMRMIGSIMDIHERKKAESLKSEFISTVSHELRTPMTSIIGALELVRSNKFGEMSPKAGELLGIATSNGRRLVRLINDILDIEKLEAEKLKLVMRPVQVSETIHEAIRQNDSFVRIQNAEISFVDETELIVTNGDSDRIIQVLTNLISNAAKFTQDDGKIKVRSWADAEHVYIGVSDNGPGIPTDKLGNVFEKFVQLDGASNRAKDGTGLGLSISNAIVRAHDGTLEVESKVGHGTTFTVVLKRLHGGECRKVETDDSKSNAVSGALSWRILHVEDDADSAAIFQHILSDVAEVEVVQTVTAATARLKEVAFDLAVVDLILGSQNGADVIEYISKREGKPPVIIYSIEDVSGDVYPDCVVGRYLKSRISNIDLREAIVSALSCENPDGLTRQQKRSV